MADGINLSIFDGIFTKVRNYQEIDATDAKTGCSQNDTEYIEELPATL